MLTHHLQWLMLIDYHELSLCAQAFFLYDTMGFPVDLTQLMAAEQGLAVDMPGFDAEMAAQKR
jgi:alanyl-tRNA synthetase